jgi:hypothetical protein
MKKILLVAAVLLASASLKCYGDAALFLNNYDADKPIFYNVVGTKASGADFFIQVLGGPVGGPLAPIASSAGGDKFTLVEAGYFDGGYGSIPGVADNDQVLLQVRAWKGTTDYAAASERGETVAWQQKAGAAPGGSPPPPPTPAALSMPDSVLVIIPEPSTIALGLLGAALLLIRRRK